LVRVRFHRFDGVNPHGLLVVRQREAGNVVKAMRELYRAGYPLRRLRPIDAFGGDADRARRADDTFGFACERVAGTSRWSAQAKASRSSSTRSRTRPSMGTTSSPSKGQGYADRTLTHRGDHPLGETPSCARSARSAGAGAGTSSPTKRYQLFVAP
jgi:hypothetical protein